MVRASEIHIEPRLIRSAVETPRMRELRAAVRERYRVSDEGARSFAERLLTQAVERFGLKYLNEMAEHIERAFRLREEAATIIEKVIGPEALSPDDAAARLEGLFRDIKSNIDAVTGPEAFAKAKPPTLTAEDVAHEFDLTPEGRAREQQLKAGEVPRKALPSGRHAEQLSVLSKSFKSLAQRSRKTMRKAADLAPRELWRTVSSETEGGLERNMAALTARVQAEGMSPSEIEALERAVRAMSEERVPRPPQDRWPTAQERARLQRGAGPTEAELRAEGVRSFVTRLENALAEDKGFAKAFPDLAKLGPKSLRQHLTRLQELIAGDRYMELLAAENPRQLLEFFEKSGAKSKTALRRYIRGRMVTHIRGLLGEFTSAFKLGEEGIVLLKAPDYDVTIPGTDLVGVTRDGRIWLIDNKALAASELESVTALTRNIRDNIAKDAAAAAEEFGTAPDPLIGDAVARLNRATEAIQKVTGGLSPKEVGAPSVQRQIADICAQNGIDRVVTNAGGKVQGLSDALQQAKILLEDFNKPH
jgi:hypothetical protein